DLVRAEATLQRAASQPRVDARVRQSLAVVLGLQRRAAPGVSPAILPPAEVNVAHLRQALAQQNGWRASAESEKPVLRAAAGARCPPGPRRRGGAERAAAARARPDVSAR